MSRKIWLSAGHSIVVGADRGASGNGFVEGNLTAELRELIYNELEVLGICAELDKNSNALKETIQAFKNLVSPSCILLDIHWNSSSNPTSTGTETFIPENYTEFELELASKLSKCISDTLEIPLRGSVKGKLGVKTEAMSARKTLGFMRLTGINVLIEVAFISNKSDMDKYQANKRVLAFKLANILYTYANK
jgi:N-acetylmuramoyl-L-alanine amidase